MATPNTQEQGSSSNALPVYYGEKMQDGSIIESPRAPHSTESRDALLRLPIQPGDAHLHNHEVVTSPVPLTGSLHPNTLSHTGSKRVGMSTEPTRYISYPQEEYRHSSRRYERDPYEREPPMYRGSGARQPQVEEYYEEEDRPQAYRRPVRRYARPPLSHKHMPSGPRYSRDHLRGSVDSGRPSTDRLDRLDYEPDTPPKPRYQYYDESGDESPRHPKSYYASSGRGGRGPPNRPPSNEEVMRIPWTMWMNSNAKNRKIRPKPNPDLKVNPVPQCLLPPLFGGFPLPPSSPFPAQPSILSLL
jgi:aquaporin related protein